MYAIKCSLNSPVNFNVPECIVVAAITKKEQLLSLRFCRKEQFPRMPIIASWEIKSETRYWGKTYSRSVLVLTRLGFNRTLMKRFCEDQQVSWKNATKEK